jgi:dTDP-glucose 4,6-dehydratase
VVDAAALELDDVTAVMHLASPASPPEYLRRPLDTLMANSVGTHQLLELAQRHDALFFLASTSEVYGDPLVHPQPESYWGNVNPNGERSVYDEAKRFAESITMTYHRTYGLDVRIARIFNTYGPRMQPDDGRVVTNFIHQALAGEPITIYGAGSQTRSFCYVDDEVDGFIALLDSDYVGPVNIGNPDEFTMQELAQLVMELTDTSSEIVYRPLPSDDPQLRQPDISLAVETLGWSPAVGLREGLTRTIEWFRS